MTIPTWVLGLLSVVYAGGTVGFFAFGISLACGALPKWRQAPHYDLLHAILSLGAMVTCVELTYWVSVLLPAPQPARNDVPIQELLAQMLVGIEVPLVQVVVAMFAMPVLGYVALRVYRAVSLLDNEAVQSCPSTD